MSTEDQEVGQWLFYASEDLAYGKLGQITPAVRYPSDDQTAVTTGDAEKYAESAERVHKWAIEKHEKLD